MAAVLVTLQQAKDHLQIPTMAVGDPDEADVILKLNQAEAIILNLVSERADPAWVSPETAPPEITSAILLMLGGLRRHRGDLMEADPELWAAIMRRIRRYRLEAIAEMAEIGTYIHRVILQRPGPMVPDGDGGSVASWIDLAPPAWKVSIDPATASDLERVVPGTVISSATYIVRGAFHPGVTTQCRLLLNGRILSVTGLVNRELRNVDMELGVVEVVL